MTHRPLAAALFLCSALAVPAGAASKITIAAAGEGVPGGGVFAGPSFVGEPSAAGNGWVAFRTRVTGGTTAEEIVVDNMASPGSRQTVTSIGAPVTARIGTIRQFLGRPAVNARGEVAFVAAISPPEDARSDPFAPAPAGVFLWRAGSGIQVVAEAGFETDFGILDLTTPVNFLTEASGIDLAERTPALNDNGDVAFVAATLNPTGGAIFLRRSGQPLRPMVKLDDPYPLAEGKVQILGPPALNNAGTLAFRALVDQPNFVDGVFKVDAAGQWSLVVRDGNVPPDTLTPVTSVDTLFEFGDVVALNDAGDVACTVAGLLDTDDASLDDLEGANGVVVVPNGGAPLLVAFPGMRVEEFDLGRISDVALGPEFGSRIAPPSLMPDGRVIFLAELNAGSSQVILRADPVERTLRPLVTLGGPNADSTPAGGTYGSASSAPAVDATGGIAFSARLEGATRSEALIYRQATGEAVPPIPIGEPVPGEGTGYFGGPPFFAPHLNDAGDVVFKGYLVAGPGGLGIFRFRQGRLEPVVRVGDPSPLPETPPPLFTNLVGQLSLNKDGDVAFAARVRGRNGRGIFVTKGGAVRAVAMTGDDLQPPDPRFREPFFRTIATNPSLSDEGAVVFRGVIQYESRFGFELAPDRRAECMFLFLADTSGIRILACKKDDSGAGFPFLTFHDPTIAGRSVLFRATIGEIEADGTEFEKGAGFFLADPAGVRPIAVEGDNLGGIPLRTVRGRALFDAAGNIYFAGQVGLPGASRSAIIRRTPAGVFEPVVQTGDQGPEGGRIRSLGRPSVSSDGRVALRIGFEPFSGGVGGLFLARDGRTFQPYVRGGEGGAARIGGRITSFNQNVSVNSNDRVAFLSSVGGGESPNAIFLAMPTTLRVPELIFTRGSGTPEETGSPPRDRVRLTAVMEAPRMEGATGDEGDGSARPKTVRVTVGHASGTLWSGTLQSRDTKVRGRTLKKRRGATESGFRKFRATFNDNGTIHITARSVPIDLSGPVIPRPPFSVSVDIGEDGGSKVVECRRGRPRFRCRSSS